MTINKVVTDFVDLINSAAKPFLTNISNLKISKTLSKRGIYLEKRHGSMRRVMIKSSDT
jgi:hypothetical protein